MKKLKQVQKYLNKIPNINKGGCGISTLAMFRWLKENTAVGNTKFVFLYSDKDRYLNNQKVLRDKRRKAEVPNHSCLLFQGEFIDSTGLLDISNFAWIQIVDEEEFLIRVLDNVKDWNWGFDRNYIKKIEKKLKLDLEDIKGLNEIDD